MGDEFYFIILVSAMVLILIIVLIFGVFEDPQKDITVESSDSTICLLEKSDNYKIYYDKSTLVMYLEIIDSGEKIGITPMYNSDGTIKLYNEENKYD